jgi:hypothetical protein
MLTNKIINLGGLWKDLALLLRLLTNAKVEKGTLWVHYLRSTKIGISQGS